MIIIPVAMIIIPVAVVIIPVSTAVVGGGTMGDMIHIDPASMFQIAVTATIIIIVQAAIDIDGLSVSNDVSRFNSITRSIP